MTYFLFQVSALMAEKINHVKKQVKHFLSHWFSWPGTPDCIHGEMSVPSPCVSSLVVLMGANSLTTSSITCWYRQRSTEHSLSYGIVLFLHYMPIAISSPVYKLILNILWPCGYMLCCHMHIKYIAVVFCRVFCNSYSTESTLRFVGKFNVGASSKWPI